ncbi:MAG: hypothetical protein KJZ80_04045 [Hyphomicrobiaceae bacterium]|nr:hypothetical protein [Hyphomicrobiaceae bacterium]
MTAKPITIAAAAAVLIAQIAAPGIAHAKKGHGRPLIEKHYEFAGPVKGYSGFAGGYYCDYQRIPNRQCVVTPSGQEHCKIVSWTLKQVCY